MKKGLNAPSMMMVELPHPPSHARRVNPYDKILQHLHPVTPAFSTHRFSAGCSRDARGAPCSWVRLLDTIRSDAVLPPRARAVAARDLWRVGELRRQIAASRGAARPEALDLGVR